MDSELLSKFLSGQATEEEIARLRTEIAADPDAVDSLFQAAELERDLGEVLNADVTAVAPNPRRWRLLAAAAVVLAAVTGYIVWVKSASAPVSS